MAIGPDISSIAPPAALRSLFRGGLEVWPAADAKLMGGGFSNRLAASLKLLKKRSKKML